MATFNDSNTKQLEELLTCAICLDYYEDPRLLPCSHTFCLKCIQKLVQNDKVQCPMRDDTLINQTDINKLPINRTAKDMVEFVLSMNISTSRNESQLCDNCSENQAINWCDKCPANYCESCTKSVHSLKVLQSHIIVPLSEKTQQFCIDHPDEKFKYWCHGCEILVCRDCLLFKHKDHTFLPLKDAAADAKSKLQEAIQQTDEIKQNLTKFSDKTKRITNQHREIIHQQKEHIHQTFADLQRKLDERKHVIVKQLEDEEAQTMSILHQQQNTIDQHLNLTTVQELCTRKMLESNDPMQILKFKSGLSGNHKDFTEQYKKIDEGFAIMSPTFKKDDRDIEQITGKISTLGSIDSISRAVKRDVIQTETPLLDISKQDGDTRFTEKHINYVRGYRLSLKKLLKLHSIRIQADHVGQMTSFIVNDKGIIIQKNTVDSAGETMQWLAIPIECDVQNNYSLLVCSSTGDGSYAYKSGNNQVRTINQYCSVVSKYTVFTTQINVGSQIKVEDNTYSIDMILGIEE